MNYLTESLKETFGKCLMLATKKNKDYAGEENRFKNIAYVLHYNIDPKAALIERLSDKFSRLTNIIISKQEAEVKDKDKTIEDTIQDMITSLAILQAYINYTKPK